MIASICPVCLDEFGIQNNRPAVGTCGHSICSSCLLAIQQTTSRSCPRCTQSNAFAHTKINFQMIEMMEDVQKRKKEQEEIRAAEESSRLKLKQEFELLQREKENDRRRAAEEVERLKLEKQNERVQLDKELKRLQIEKEKELLKSEKEAERLKLDLLKAQQEAVETKASVKEAQEGAERRRINTMQQKKRNRSVSRPRQSLQTPACHPKLPVKNPLMDYKGNTTNLQVSNLEINMKDYELYQLFERYGQITSATILTDARGRSTGFGSVFFRDINDAINAMSDINSTMVKGKVLSVKIAESKEDMQTPPLPKQFGQKPNLPHAQKIVNVNPDNTVKGTKLYVNNLDESITGKQFTALFQPYGKLKNANLVHDRDGKSKGYGTVVYLNINDAIYAMTDLDKKLVGSKQISVKFMEDKIQGQSTSTNT